MHVQRSGFAVGMRTVAESRVHAVVVFWGYQLEGELLAEIRITEARFDGRLVIQFFGAEVAFAIGRAEVAFRKWLERLRHAETDEMLTIEMLEGDSFNEWVW